MTETQPNIAFPDVNLKISVTSWPELPIELQQVCGKYLSPKINCSNQESGITSEGSKRFILDIELLFCI